VTDDLEVLEWIAHEAKPRGLILLNRMDLIRKNINRIRSHVEHVKEIEVEKLN
jgi:hypothetical protein